MNTELQGAVQEGIDAADTQDAAEQQRKRAERQQVTDWLNELKDAREFDTEVRKGYARDRRYARGDSGFEVAVPLIASAIDTIVDHTYARNPDVSAIPARMVEAPKDPMPAPPTPPAGLQGLLADPTAALAQGGGDLEGAAMAAGYQLAQEQAKFQQAQAEYEAKLAEWQAAAAARRQLRLERMLFAQTLEIVVGKLWKKGKLKRRARRAVRSALTTGIGWIKLSWQERTQRDPVIQQQINDLQNAVAHIARQMEELEDTAAADELDARRLSIQQQMAGLREKAEIVVARGMAIDFVFSENIQVAPGTDILEYLDAPWIDERIYKTIADAATRWPDIPLEQLRKATRYSRRRPKSQHGAPETEVSDGDADQYVIGETAEGKSDADYICVEEKWSLDDGLVYRTAQGLDFWLDEPAPPNVMSARFYAYFALAFFEVDGERSPQSLPYRTWKLENEYNRTRTAGAEMRRRSYPAVLFDEGEIDPDNMRKIEAAQRQEYVGVKTTGGRPVGECFAPKPVSSIDPAMIDTTQVMRDFDRTSGTQEALQGTIETAKTATEADIQDSGFQVRTESKRDAQEDWLGEIARYTATIAVQKLDHADILPLAGPDAVWPTLDTPEELESLIDVDIRAGTSGKPNTRAEREAWQVLLPVLTNAVQQVAQLRGSPPQEVADKIEALVEETMIRSGDPAADVSRYLPQGEGMVQPPMPGGAPTGPGAMPAAAPLPAEAATTETMA